MDDPIQNQAQIQVEIQQILDGVVHDLVEQLVAKLQDHGISFNEVRIVTSPPLKVPGVRDSIIALVRRSDYLGSSQIANQLQNEITTKSDDPRRVIVSTVSALVREGILTRDRLGCLSVAETREVVTT